MCQSIDVRNKPQQLNYLKNCRVIEGFLQILLIDSYEEHDYENMTFPLLTEITDFLLVFRVNGLKSIGKMFPNLSVIRGNALFNNYALVIYEVFQLEEIGLKSLQYIGRGAVRIEKNPLLCFVDSIDWTAIASTVKRHDDNMFLLNKKDNECPVCPSNMTELDANNCAITTLVAKRKHHCWNLSTCQIQCLPHCERNCNSDGKCCDKSCIGGCGKDPKNCTACNHFSLGDYRNRQCVTKCPDKYFVVSSRGGFVF